MSQCMMDNTKLNPSDGLAKQLLGRLRRKRITESTTPYATVEDIRSIFSNEMDSLYHLSFLLTGDPQLAEQCFVAGLEDSVKQDRVFKEWARSWAKRAIIKNAVRAIRPLDPPTTATESPAPKVDPAPTPEDAYSAVLALANFERFVFVTTVLESYSDHDIALLLDCSSQNIRDARTRALQQFATEATCAQR